MEILVRKIPTLQKYRWRFLAVQGNRDNTQPSLPLDKTTYWALNASNGFEKTSGGPAM
jgi:hypothetical protein